MVSECQLVCVSGEVAHLGKITPKDTSLDPVDHKQGLGSNGALLRPVYAVSLYRISSMS
jgi:hypothetical protein